MKSPRVLLLLSGMAVILLLVSLFHGGTEISAGQFEALLQSPFAAEQARLRILLFEVRLPRVLVAFLVGAALGVSGAALQGLFRNPLADPSVLGVSGTAALFAQFMIFLGWANQAPFVLPVAASLGAAAATVALVFVLGDMRHGALEMLVLGGVALGQMAIAASSLLVSISIADFTVARRLMQWMLGSLDGRTWMHVFWGLGPVVGGVIWLIPRARQLDGMMLGDVTALSLGVDVRRTRRDVILATALLTGTAVAMGGIVSFVGLLVPHVVRRFVGVRHLLLLPACALAGGSLLVVADLAARTLWAPQELQIGVITAAVGAPWFAWLLRQRFREVAA